MMRTRSLVLALFLSLAAASFSAQRQGFTINPATPEGRLLQQVGQESDDAKKIALISAEIEMSGSDRALD